MLTDKEIVQCLPHLKNYANYLDRGNSADLLQETFKKAFENRKLFKNNTLKGWLITIMHNEYVSLIIRKNAKKRDCKKEIERNLERTNIQQYDRIEINTKKLKNIIRNYKYQGKESIMLRYFFGLSYEDIAEFTGRKINSIKGDIHLFRKYMNLYYKLEDFIL
jgi:RNA polymerase sigma-70 factor (ECF subfamily)